MCVTMTPISSICPASMMRGEPPGLSTAIEFPLTSASTWSAKPSASVRQTRAGWSSKPLGPGASSSCSRNAKEPSVIISLGRAVANIGSVGMVEVLDEHLGRVDLGGQFFDRREGAECLRLLRRQREGDLLARHLRALLPPAAQRG